MVRHWHRGCTTAQGRGAVTVLGGAPEPWDVVRGDTAMLVVGGWLDEMITVVFSNCNDCIILRFSAHSWCVSRILSCATPHIPASCYCRTAPTHSKHPAASPKANTFVACVQKSDWSLKNLIFLDIFHTSVRKDGGWKRCPALSGVFTALTIMGQWYFMLRPSGATVKQKYCLKDQFPETISISKLIHLKGREFEPPHV